MPFPVQHLIEGKPSPTTVNAADSVQSAVELMTEHDFSQLPVIDEICHPLGMVTTDSILRAIAYFGITTGDLRVSDAMVRASTFRQDDDVFDILDSLRDAYAVLIVDAQRRLVGIVTSYDSMDYFRRRAEDIMFVEDIEATLKDFIVGVHTGEQGELDEDILNDLASKARPSADVERRRLASAISFYMSQASTAEGSVRDEIINAAYAKFYTDPTAPKFGMLTMNDIIELFLYRVNWAMYGSQFSISPGAIRTLLHRVRGTRNDLAHFREISDKQRQELKFCKEWLGRHELPQAISRFPPPSAETQDSAASDEEPLPTGAESRTIIPLDESLSPSDSRYAPLALWLNSRPSAEDRVQLSFDQVQEIIDSALPKSARQNRSWWANDSVSHPQARQWLEVGWRVGSVNMSDQLVNFARIREREATYIRFFSSLLDRLRRGGFPEEALPSPGGQSWITLRRVSSVGMAVAIVALSFTRDKRLRIELYIDSGNSTVNKATFDQIASRREDMEREIGETLSWERMDDRRASRIAVYHEGSITSSESQLEELRDWAVAQLPRFEATVMRYLMSVVGQLELGV